MLVLFVILLLLFLSGFNLDLHRMTGGEFGRAVSAMGSVAGLGGVGLHEFFFEQGLHELGLGLGPSEWLSIVVALTLCSVCLDLELSQLNLVINHQEEKLGACPGEVKQGVLVAATSRAITLPCPLQRCIEDSKAQEGH